MLTEHNKHDSDIADSDSGLHEQELSCRIFHTQHGNAELL